MPTLDEWLAKNAPVASSPALMAAPDVAPDQAAAALQQARRNGIPTSLAPSTPDPDIERQERLQANAAALRQAPTLDQWLASQPDLVTASVQDDVEGLSRVEQAVRAVVNAGKAAQAGFFGFNEGFYGAAQATGALLPDVIGDPIERYSNQFRLESQAFAQAAMPEGEGTLARGVYSGFQSVGAMIPALAAGVATRNPNVTLGIMSGMTFGQSFGEAKDAGKDAATSLLYGFNQASIEFLTEKIPVGMLFGDLAKGTGLGTMIMRQLGAEMVGEQAATLGQDFNQWVTLNPDKTMSEFLAERPAAALETAIATVVATGAVTAGSVGADAAMRRLSGEESRAEQRQREAELLQNLNQLAGATVVRERDVNTFEGFLQSVTEGTPVEALYIDGRALLDSGLAGQLAEASPAVAAQLEAAQAGTMVRIPTAEVMGRFNQELAPLLPDMRTDPNGMTQREADEYVKTRGETLRAEVETLLAVPENEAQAREDREAVRTQVASDLMATGRVTADVADTYALLTSAFYATQAKRFGMSARELYQQERVRILGEGQGELDQPGYHGSPHRFKRFDLSKIGTGEGAQAYGWGQYFADSRGVAESYQLKLSDSEGLGPLISAREGAIETFKKRISAGADPEVYEPQIAALQKEVDEMRARVNPGQLYTVDIPDDAMPQMLDWDQKLSSQPDAVRKAWQKFWSDRDPDGMFKNLDGSLEQDVTGRMMYQFLKEQFAKDGPAQAQRRASEFLASMGVPGLRYLDGNSRGAGEGTRNTVVWDQALLDRISDSMGVDQLNQLASTIDVDGVARPTQNSEGRPLAGTEEEIRNFWRWFGDSKVVDDQGRPLVVYHGTAAEFTEFKPSVTGNLGPGIYFTPDKEQAEAYARTHQGARVVDAYIRAENPLLIDNSNTSSQQLYAAFPADSDEATIAKVREAGHDAVWAVNSVKTKWGATTREIAVYDPTQIKSATGNDGTFDEDDPSILSQQARGSFSPRELTIRLLKAQDLSTFLHESGHFYLHLLTVLASRPDAPVEVRQDVDTLLTWMGVEGSPELSRLDTWMRMSVDQQRAGHEKMARGFEVYLADGKAPSVELQQAFDRLRSWLLAVYRSLVERVRAKRGNTFGKEMQAELNDEVRAVFDRMLASEDEARNLEAAQSMGMMFRTEEEAARLGVDWTSYQRQGEAATQAAQTELTKRTIADMRWLDNARSRLLRRLQSEARDTRREVRSQVRVEVMSEPIYRVYQFLRAKVGEEDDVPNPVPKSDPDKVDPGIDDLLTAIAKLGGVNRDEAVSSWAVDLGGQRSPTPVFGKPVFRATGGETLDGMGEKLAELGYLRLDRNGKYDLAEFEEKLTQAMAGETVYSNQVRDDVLVPPLPGEGLNLEGMGGGRLDYFELRAMEGVDDATRNLLRERRMVAKSNGLHPDVVAAQFGFTSGDELVRKLAEVRPPNEEIEARTDERMLREHADLATPEGRDAAVNAALATEARARMVETELLAVERAVRADVRTAKGTTQNTLPAAARRFARDVVARIKVRELRVGQFTRSASRAAKAAMKAQTQGNLAETALEKRNELVNVYAGREAAEAHDDVRSGVEYLRKFQNEGTRKNVDPDYLDQIDAILERYELKRITNRGLDKRKALNDWIAEQEAMGITPDLPPHVADAAKRTNYRELTVEEFRGLVDSVRQIEHFGRLKKKLLLAKDRREFLAVVAEINRSVQEAAGTRRADNRTRTHVGAMLAQGFKAFTAAHRKMASIAYELDGFKDGGPVWESLVRTANERGNWEASRQAELTGKLAVLLKMLPRERRWTKGRFFPRLGISLTQEERISVALNWGNEGNRQRLLDGRTWSPMQVQSVLDTLTAEEWQFVQGVWDMFESLRPEVGAKEKRVMGKEPNWVEPTPVVTKFGTLRGGYYPISYDTGESLRAEQDADAEMAKRQLQGARTAATTRRNFVKARAEEVKGRPVLLTMDGLFRGLTDVVHDLAWHEWLIDANRLVRAVDPVVRERYGAETMQQLRTAIEAIAAGEATKPWALDKPLRHIRIGSMVAGLGFNLVNAMMQPLGLTNSVVRIGPRWVAQGAAAFAANPVKLAREVMGKSEFMRNRKRTQNRELNELRNRLRGQSELRQFIDGAMFLPMTAIQMTVDLPTWWGAYQKAVADGVDEDGAVQRADQAVLASQGGGQMKDLAAVQRGPEVAKLFTVFYGFFSVAYNLGAERARATNFKSPAQVARLATDFLLLYSVPAVLGLAIKEAFSGGDDDDEELAKKLGAEQVSYLFGLMVGVREATGAAQILLGLGNKSGLGYGGPAGLRFFGELQKFAQQAEQGELDRAFVRAGVNLGGIALHLPSAQINRTIDGIVALEEGRTTNPAAVIGGAPPQ